MRNKRKYDCCILDLLLKACLTAKLWNTACVMEQGHITCRNPVKPNMRQSLCDQKKKKKK